MQDGKITFGTPSRTLETSGSFSVNRQTSVLEGTFGWDAGRDTTKQVGFNAKVITGEKTRTDITFRLPGIGKVFSNSCHSVSYLLLLIKKIVLVIIIIKRYKLMKYIMFHKHIIVNKSMNTNHSSN